MNIFSKLPLLSKYLLTPNGKDDSKMKFVAFNRNWADEFNVYGFALMTTEEWNEYSEKLKITNSVSFCFGTNEDFDDVDGKDFLRSFDVTDITPEDAHRLREIFKLKKMSWKKFESWGIFPDDPFPEDEDNSQDEW